VGCSGCVGESKLRMVIVRNVLELVIPTTVEGGNGYGAFSGVRSPWVYKKISREQKHRKHLKKLGNIL